VQQRLYPAVSWLVLIALLMGLPAAARAAGVPLRDASGAAHGTAVLNLARGQVTLKITGLALLPAAVSGGGTPFTADSYKAYAFSSANPAVEIFLTDVYPNTKQRATRRIALGGDASHMGIDRVAVTAYSSDGQQSFDVLTATFAP
jgi:hypothetical protein